MDILYPPLLVGTKMENDNNKTQTERIEERRDARSESDAASGDVSAGSSESSRRGRKETAAENGKFFRKRSRPEGDRGSSSEGEQASARKIPTSKRGGIRGKGRGLRLAKEGRHPEVAGPGAARSGSSTGDEVGAAGGSETERKASFAKAVEAALKGLAYKKLPSSKQKAIPTFSASILAAAEATYAGPPTGEVAKLRAEVARLTATTELLQKENEKLRADLAGLRKSGPPPRW